MYQVDWRDRYAFYKNKNTALSLIQATGFLEPDRQGKSHTCPFCGNGQGGGKGDGLYFNENGSMHCFNCQWHGYLFDMVGKLEGISEPEAQLQRSNEIFGIEIINIPPKNARRQKKIAKPMNYAKNDRKRENEHFFGAKQAIPKDYALPQIVLDQIEGRLNYEEALIKKARQDAEANPQFKSYVEGVRGISMQTALAYGMGYIKSFDYKYIDTKTGKQKIMKLRNGVIIATTKATWGFRSINPPPKSPKYYKTPEHDGIKDIFTGLDIILANREKKLDGSKFYEPFFVVEGFFDAPSIYEVGADAIALNGIGNIDLLIGILKHYDIKRPVILAMDNDATGKKNQEKNLRLLLEAGINAFGVNLAEGIPSEANPGQEVKDANELLVQNEALFKEIVKNAVNTEKIEHQKLIDQYNQNLNKNKKQSYIDRLFDEKRNKIPTGFEQLDSKEFLDGGLDEGLYILGAVSGLGKSALAIQMADQIATAGHDVIYYSLEMAEDEIRDRSISRYTAQEIIDQNKIKTNVGWGQFNRFAKTQNQISHEVFARQHVMEEQQHVHKAINGYFADTGEHLRIIEGVGTIDADQITTLVQKHVELTGQTPVVFIDYLQLLAQPKDEGGRMRSMTDKQITDINVLKLKQLSRDYKMPIFAISSLNRDSYNQAVTLKSFKESGAIEYTSSVLFGLERVNLADKEKLKADMEKESQTGIKKLRLKILKNRHGRADGDVKFDYYCLFNYFKEEGMPKVFESIPLQDEGSKQVIF